MPKRSITTRAGDGGKTRLFSGEIVSKHDLRIEALGEVDELVSALGLARAAGLMPAHAAMLLRLQRTLFRVGSVLAWVPHHEAGGGVPGLEAADLEALDALCRALEDAFEMPSDFIVPGASPGGAALDYARALARRCERRIVACLDAGIVVDERIGVWMNRLSDALWLLARTEEQGSTPLRDRGE